MQVGKVTMMSRAFAVMAAFVALSFAGGQADAQQTSPAARPLINQALNERPLVPWTGNPRSDARAAANKSPAVADNTRLDHIQMLLRRSPEREQAAAAYVDSLS